MTMLPWNSSHRQRRGDTSRSKALNALQASVVVPLLLLVCAFAAAASAETISSSSLKASAPASLKRSWVDLMLLSPNSKWMITLKNKESASRINGERETSSSSGLEAYLLSSPNWSTAVLVDTADMDGYRSATLRFPSNASSPSLTVQSMTCEEYWRPMEVIASSASDEEMEEEEMDDGSRRRRRRRAASQPMEEALHHKGQLISGRCAFALAMDGKPLEEEPFFAYRVSPPHRTGSSTSEVGEVGVNAACPRGKHCSRTSLNIYERVLSTKTTTTREEAGSARKRTLETVPLGHLEVMELSKLKISGLTTLFYVSLSFEPSPVSSTNTWSNNSPRGDEHTDRLKQFLPSEFFLYGDIEQYPGAWEAERVHLVRMATESEVVDFFVVPGGIVLSIYLLLRIASWKIQKGKQQQQGNKKNQ